MDAWQVTHVQKVPVSHMEIMTVRESQESGTSDWFYTRSQTFAVVLHISFNDFRSFCCAVVTFSFFQRHPFLRYLFTFITSCPTARRSR